jgi:hypothetical protein
MEVTMKTRNLFLIVLLVSSISALAQNSSAPFQITPHADFKFFGWKEFGDNGDELLKESGLLYSFGVVPRLAFGDARKFFVESEMFVNLGTVDYDGFLQDAQGQQTPFKTKTVYFGFEVDPAAGYVLSLSKQFDLTPTAGFGFEHWKRNLDNGGPNGYDEKYSVFLFQVSVNGKLVLNRDIHLLSGLGIKIPVSISESVDLASRGQGGPSDINLSPGISPRIRIGAGASIYHALIEFSFETWTLTKSSDDKNYHQPESTRKMFGIRLGYEI